MKVWDKLYAPDTAPEIYVRTADGWRLLGDGDMPPVDSLPLYQVRREGCLFGEYGTFEEAQDHVDLIHPQGVIGLAEIFPSGAWTIDRNVFNRPAWLERYRQGRSGSSRVLLFRPDRTLDEVRNILFRWMRRLGIEPADTVKG